MNGAWHYLARASGIVATALIVAALGGGLLFSARATGRRRHPNWWLDLHNHLGGLAFVFTAVHVVAVFANKDVGLTRRESGPDEHDHRPARWAEHHMSTAVTLGGTGIDEADAARFFDRIRHLGSAS